MTITEQDLIAVLGQLQWQILVLQKELMEAQERINFLENEKRYQMVPAKNGVKVEE